MSKNFELLKQYYTEDQILEMTTKSNSLEELNNLIKNAYDSEERKIFLMLYELAENYYYNSIK